MANLIRTLIVDDEPMARQGIRRLLGDDAEIEVVGEAGNGAEAVEMIAQLRPELLLLDIQMPEMNGFEVLSAVGLDRALVVVFVTAHDKFALQAFEAQALDYLLKPFDDDRFAAVIARAKRQVRLTGDAELQGRLRSLLLAYGSESKTHASRIMVKHAGKVIFQPVEEIDWIEGADYFAKLHVGSKVHLVNETLTSLEQRLPPATFMRVHRSAIVNLTRIRELRLDYQNRHIIVLANGSRVPLSRSRREQLSIALAGKTE